MLYGTGQSACFLAIYLLNLSTSIGDWDMTKINSLSTNFCYLGMSRANVNLCRRHSGGGTVYHDLGNLNFTFFTERCDYDRKHNLNVIIDGLKSKFADLNIAFNIRDDILLNDK